ncbi:MAG: DUF5667 domain-containing protein [bacterium]
MISNRGIIKELQNLKSVKPDHDFFCKNKEKLIILMNENVAKEEKRISLAKFSSLLYNFNSKLFYRLAKPVGILVVVFSVLTGGGAGISFAAYNSVPGDVFYPVKLTIEKAQISLTTKEEDKVKLEVEFAGRRIEELNKVKAKEVNGKKKEPENTKIALDNFKKNIATVQQRLEKIKEQEFTNETIEVVNLVEEKTVEYAAALKNISNAVEMEKIADDEEKAENLTNDNSLAGNQTIASNEGKEGEKAEEAVLIDNSDVNGTSTISSATSSPESDLAEDKNDISATSTDGNLTNISTTTEQIVQDEPREGDNEDAIDNEKEIQVLKEALEISENLGIKAVDIIVSKQNNGGINLSQEEIAKKVKNKADNIKNEMDDIKSNFTKENGTSTGEFLSEEKTVKVEDGDGKEAMEGKEGEKTLSKRTNDKQTVNEIENINNKLGEVDGLLEQGDMITAFGKVKEANELKRNVKIKIEKESKEKSILENAELRENASEQKNASENLN